MAEYATGSSGRIYIEDSGSWIYVYVDARQGATNTGRATFSWSDPIGSGSSSFSYPAGSGKKLILQLGPFGQGQGGTVWFTLDATGTSGLGGPTTVSFGFSRAPAATVPPAPSNIALDQITPTGMRYIFTNNGDGGSAIIRWEYQCAEDPSMNVGWAPSSGTTVRDDLRPGTVYYWRARGVNAVGPGAPSSIISARTLSGAYVGKGGQFPSTEVFVGKGGQFVPAEVRVGKGGVFVPGG